MSALIGSTGFVGGHLQKSFEFSHTYNRANISEIQGLETDLLICAGLPAEKWKANLDPELDWWNMANLAQLVSTVETYRAVLISTIDVYQPAVGVTENDPASLNGVEGYGRNRAWFESFFAMHFPQATIIRLPGLFGDDLKKNLIFDLMNNRSEDYEQVSQESLFQYFDISQLGEVITKAVANNLQYLNVATEPILAQEIANIFGKKLGNEKSQRCYDMQTLHAEIFEGDGNYLQSKEEVIKRINRLIVDSKK